MQFDFNRMLRLDGAEPTIREKWKAFHQLWRASVKDQLTSPIDAWYVLLGRYDWIALMNQTGDVWEQNRFMPRAMRWARVRRIRQERLEKRQRFGARLLRAIMNPVENMA